MTQQSVVNDPKGFYGGVESARQIEQESPDSFELREKLLDGLIDDYNLLYSSSRIVRTEPEAALEPGAATMAVQRQIVRETNIGEAKEGLKTEGAKIIAQIDAMVQQVDDQNRLRTMADKIVDPDLKHRALHQINIKEIHRSLGLVSGDKDNGTRVSAGSDEITIDTIEPAPKVSEGPRDNDTLANPAQHQNNEVATRPTTPSEVKVAPTDPKNKDESIVSGTVRAEVPVQEVKGKVENTIAATAAPADRAEAYDEVKGALGDLTTGGDLDPPTTTEVTE